MYEEIMSLITPVSLIIFLILRLYNNREHKKVTEASATDINAEAVNPEQPDDIKNKKEHIRALKVMGSMTVLLILLGISIASILEIETGSWTRDFTTLDITLCMIASSSITIMLNLLFTQAEKQEQQDNLSTSHEIEG